MASSNYFVHALKRFCEISKEIKEDFDKFTNRDSKWNKKDVYKKLATYLVNPIYTEDVVNHFRRDFLNILFLAIDFNDMSKFDANVNAQNTILLTKLIDIHPDTQSFALRYFKKFPAPFDDTNQTSPIPKRRKTATKQVGDFEITLACYKLLQYKPEYFITKWNWSIFFEKYCKTTDKMVQWIYCHCVGIYFGMNETTLNKYLNYYLTKEQIIECSLKYEKYTVNRVYEAIETSDVVEETEISNSEVVFINGIYLPVYDKSKVININLIEVESTKRNLRKLALGITTNKAINLMGTVGCGKTFSVEYLAAKTGRVLGESFIKVQLGDQTDSKMLLGTYRCTDIPGEFVWQPGVLTQAVLDGSWLLLEDIDSSSMDIASVLCGLIENNYLTVPGFRDFVPITPGFQLFVTQRLVTTISGHHKKTSSATALLEKHVLNINVEPLQTSELSEIICTLHPVLKTTATRIVSVFNLFNRENENIPRSGRLISTRDLFKWCSRAVIDFDVSSQSSALRVLQDAIDIFCCSYANTDDRINLAREISTHLGIVNEKANYFCQQYKPNLNITNNNLKVGRASLTCTETFSKKVVKFCFTRPSACLLERVMCCIMMTEPVLLVGETGTGKTSSVQYLAHTLGQKLVVINMNQQSDSADLLGGYKPVDLKFVITPIKMQFEDVFKSYFNVEANKKFLSNLNYCLNEKEWSMLLKLMMKSYEAAMKRLSNTKTEKEILYRKQWTEIGSKLFKLEAQLKHRNALAFAFIEGSLVKAVEKGYWVLLDEINLANAETLECLSGLLEGSKSSLSLLERGDKKPIERHPNFTLFACMNPSTDVGKKDLPAGLRNRFTEFFVEELGDRNDLLLLVNSYLEAMSLNPEKLDKIVTFYLQVRKEAINSLSDGLGHKPHFSLRSLCRALTIASHNPCGMFTRSLYESFCMSFLTQLDAVSYKIVEGMIAKYMIGSSKDVNAVLKQPIPEPKKAGVHLQFEDYWVLKGKLEPVIMDDYILTQSVRRNLKDLVRIVSIGRLPVLLQGDTSVGKTSLITYLAKASGYKCVRINNHEHTDLQEYIGSYVANSDGKLEFSEGLLVQAMREGHWIILDELNLAPTDVLEALNRVLDDNRELFIPETQEIVKAHPNFMLFATQNPPGAYGGRKMLSRAFRNRFVELHFNEIPHDELEFILHKRCQMPPSYAKKMINVMKDLQTRRRGSAAFAGKHGFITLRDLFRWGERYRLTQNVSSLYDWDQHLADEGYLLLAGRVRKTEERDDIASAIQKHMKRTILPEQLFTLSSKSSSVTKSILEKIMANKHKHKNIVWTYNMRQLAVLVCKALQFKEPVLLVGETGGGKTTVCSLIAENNGQKLVTLNCHMHTESGDFIGGLRPVRDHTEENLNKLFEWVDGPLVQAMQAGNLFLADEISLADDSVLERLNSLLEPERTLLIAEKSSDKNDAELIVAHKNFYFIGTMNPGGDFGKKELSPALRNRFTEIWCESCSNRQDLIDIIEHNLQNGVTLSSTLKGQSNIGNNIMDFVDWFKMQEIGKRFTISIRDILTWVAFINNTSKVIDITEAYLHGACLTFLDSLGSGVTSMESPTILTNFRGECLNFLKNQIKADKSIDVYTPNTSIEQKENLFGISPFYVKMGNAVEDKYEFSFKAPTTVFNALRLLRGLQLNKAILLEGSPGVGKTSLVTAVAKATRNKIFRVNLSDQTDISDLFGADLPVEGGAAGQFSWRDGPLLQALKQGHWILLDELNLASQSVLEGFNACLDHRGEIFIPELGKTFYVKTGTKFFGCQNPLKQGGSRRGLPQSFLNRFTQVYLTSLNDKDYFHILHMQFPSIATGVLEKMITFNSVLNVELEKHAFGHKGAPWEFNLRDLTRWCEALVNQPENCCPENLVKLIFIDRMRTLTDKEKIEELFKGVFRKNLGGNAPICYVTKEEVILGDVKLARAIDDCNTSVMKQEETCLVLRHQLHVLRSLAYCVNLNWMAVLVGTVDSGKSSVVRTLAKLCGKTLRTFAVTSAMDTTDILGGFEQADFTRHFEELVKETEMTICKIFQDLFVNERVELAVLHLKEWEKIIAELRSDQSGANMSEQTKIFLRNISTVKNFLERLIKEIDRNLSDSKKEELETLIHTAQTISDKVKEEESLNAGGKFEWVDSILVKCLQEGKWLLVDNVNLCSPAVLDRLNALLEPNGVLTIGERGVDDNGKMIEIKPHPDFRLFLTMDPKNGDISRAMRNRGLEIYMLNSEETGKQNVLDIEGLVKEQGLETSRHIKSLLHLHDFICDLILGDKPKTGDLLQASFLISQQLLRGTNDVTAFKNVLLDIYCYPKFTSELSIIDLKNKITEEIQSTLKSAETNDYLVPTLKTKSLEVNSQLELLHQQLYMFEQLFPQGFQHDQADMFIFMLINVLTISSNEDVLLRQEMIRGKINNALVDDVFKVLNKSFKCGKLPIDYRWLPDTSYTKTNESTSNKLILELLYKISLLCITETKVESKQKQKSFTLLSYLNKIQRKEMEHKIDDPVLKNIIILLQKYDEYITNLNINCIFNNAMLIDVICILQLRFHLHEYLNTKFNNVKEIDDNVLNTLHVHYKWFIKTAVKYLQNMLKINNEEINKIVLKINEDMAQHFSILRKIGKRYQKSLQKPPPLINDVQLDLIPKVQNNIEQFNIYNKHNDFNKTIQLVLSNKELRINGINAKVELDFELNNTTDLITDFIKSCDDALTIELLPSDVKILSVIDYFCSLKILKLRLDNSYTELKSYQTIPMNLAAVLIKYRSTKDRRLLFELSTEIQSYLRYSASTKPNKFITFGEEGTENITLQAHSPILTYVISNVILDENQKKGIITARLGNYRDVVKMYKNIHLLLWNNLREMNNPAYDYISSELAHLKTSKTLLLNDLASVLNVPTASGEENIKQSIIVNLSLEMLKPSAEIEDFLAIFMQLTDPEIEGLTENEILQQISNTYIIVNYLKALLNSKLPFIDALKKVSMKKEQCRKSTQCLTAFATSLKLQNDIYSDTEKSIHPLCKTIEEKITDLASQNKELGKYVAVRPKNIQYITIVKTVSHGFTTVFSPIKILQIYNSINESIEILLDAINNKKEINPKLPESVIRLATSSINSYDNFVDSLKIHRYTYPDVIEPILSNLMELIHGFNIKIGLLKKLVMQIENAKINIDLNKDILNFIQLPSLNQNRCSYTDLICDYVGDKMNNLISTKQENFRLLKCALIESANLCSLDYKYTQNLNVNLFMLLNNILQQFLNAWKKQEKEKESKKLDEESLYKMQTKCDDKTEDELAEEEFTKLFPSYYDVDFSEYQEKRLEDTPMEVEAFDYSDEITEDDLQMIFTYHCKIITTHTKTEWFTPKNINLHVADYTTPILMKSKTFKQLINKLIDCLSYKLDRDIVASLSVVTAIAKHFGDCSFIDDENSKGVSEEYNFYKDSNLDEVKSCFHILQELKLKIGEFLKEWPDHPTLQSINSIIDRINNFDITSPVPRFLTGFDILLTKCYEWEQNAHLGVTLSQHSANISYQMIQWRKLEMKHWKQALENCQQKLRNSCAKHWFYLYDVMIEYIVGKSTNREELISTLQKFIVTSNLVEFEERLNLLLVFHCHATYLEKSKERDSFISILWNLYKHYEQFLPNVATKIKNIKTPIEKKLKDFVKIVRWKDINYWALKESLLKTHKAIHKFMREYDAALKQPASPLFTNTMHQDELVGVQDRPQRISPKKYHYTSDYTLYISRLSLKEVSEVTGSDLITKSHKYFKVCKNLCQKIVDQSEYPQLVKKLDCFIGQVIATSKHLQSLEIDRTLTKEKQVSQAKGHLQQKQRALSDLFKELSKIGLSFRTGIVDSKQKDATDDYLIKPIDLTVILSHVPHNRSDDRLQILWDGAEVYYRKSFMRLEILEEALKNPAKDLGMQNIERCKGFGAHLMSVAKTQKHTLIENVYLLYQLRYYQSMLHEMQEHSKYIPIESFNNLQEILKNLIITMEQYKIIFSCCPADDLLDSEVMNLPYLNEHVQILQNKADPEWTKLMKYINKIVELTDKIFNSLNKINTNVPCIYKKLTPPSFVHIPNADQLFDDILKVCDHLSHIKYIFGNIPMTQSIDWLVTELEKASEMFTQDQKDLKKAEKLKTEVERSLLKILLGIQYVQEKYTNDEPVKKEQETEEDLNLQENHLNLLLTESITKDFASLNTRQILTHVKSIIKRVVNVNLTDSKDDQDILELILPFLDQAILLHQYFVTQLVSTYRTTCKTTSILLNIFIDLATKGFCVPSDLQDEMGDTKSEKQSSGMGLGDGEGEKDVSDKIESEDQLDDAQPAGQEKEKEEDKDCKEEEKGIEMSEDFDSKLQDIEKKPQDSEDEDNDSDNSDAEEQMGETEKDADQLDKEVWSSDNEEAPEDEGADKGEEKGDKGEKEGEQEMSAKQDDSGPQEDDEQKGKDKEQQKKDINEMDEPELDDDQVDPYHGNQPELPEPEPMDLPDDMQLDDGDNDEEEQQEENPFDIDAIKDQMPEKEDKEGPEEKKDEGDSKEDKGDDESSGDEDGNKENVEEVEEVGDEEKGDDEKNADKSEDAKEDQPDEKDDQITGLDETQTAEENVESMDNVEKAADNAQSINPQKEQTVSPNEEVQQEDNPDKEGVGQSQMEDSTTGHKGEASAKQDSQKNKKDDDSLKRKNKPSEADSERSLGNTTEPVKKKMKTIKADDTEEQMEYQERQAEMYQHIKEAKESAEQVLDTITKEQAEKLQEKEVPSLEEDADKPTEGSEELPEDKDEEMKVVDTEKQKSEKTEEDKTKKKDKTASHPEGDVEEMIHDVDIEGSVAETHTVERSSETTHHTQYGTLSDTSIQRLSLKDLNDLRTEVEKQLSVWNDTPTTTESLETWDKISSLVSSLAQDLSEQLRLVLEPTQASRLKGDFRTGRRINMRKVIPYIASQFRKDKIWLRRTKPSKREYQIVLAIDDSSSMADNHSKELAFESVALISKALTLLESGQLSILSFGEQTEVLHKLTDPFTDKSGSKLLQKFKFDQTKTCVAKLVDFATEMLNTAYSSTNSLLAKLLVVVSDGRGIFSEGESYVQQAVRRAKLSNIFMIFVIIDNPQNKNSILDIRKPIFKDGKIMEIKSYMDSFPFPFYIILRDINTLPHVLSDALRQWFEIVSNIDN